MDQTTRLSDKEVSAVLARAVELQKRDLAPREGDGRLTVAELESIAKESGIDPEYLRLALAEKHLAPGAAAPGERAGGMPRFVETSLATDGELSPEAFEDLTLRLPAIANEPGSVQILGKAIVFNRDHNAFTTNYGVPFSVSVRNREGKTLIQTRENLGIWARATIWSLALAPVPLGALSGGLLGGGLLGTLAGGLAAGALGYALARPYWKWYWNSRKRKHDRLVNDLLREIRARPAAR